MGLVVLVMGLVLMALALAFDPFAQVDWYELDRDDEDDSDDCMFQ